MLKTRLIPVLLLKDGMLVRSESFTIHQIIGNPIHEVERFNQWNVDELIYLDISKTENKNIGRNDSKVKDLGDNLSILEAVSKNCFMPLTWGGRIKTIEDIRERIARGADKVSINSQAFKNPKLITQGANTFGSQAIVVNIDAKKHKDGSYEVFVDGGKTPTGKTPAAWAKQIEEMGAGEILLQSIERDGVACGYDLELIKSVSSETGIPIIALGGVGMFEDYSKGVEAGASAVAAANIWHFKEMADRQGKLALYRAGVDVRFNVKK